jgi:hypothetical protein
MPFVSSCLAGLELSANPCATYSANALLISRRGLER